MHEGKMCCFSLGVISVAMSDFLSYFLSSTHRNHVTLLILIRISNETIVANISATIRIGVELLAIFHRIKTRQLTWIKKASLGIYNKS